MNNRFADVQAMVDKLATILAEKARLEQVASASTGGGGGGATGGGGNPPSISNLVKGTSLTQKEIDDITRNSAASSARYQAMAEFYAKPSKSVSSAAQKIAVTNVRAPITGGARAVPMANGGIVTRPTLALIGEAGAEAVIPLNKSRGAGGGAVYNITVNAGIGTSGQEVGKQIVDAIKKFERNSGPVFAKA
jgi:hypothetical protein